MKVSVCITTYNHENFIVQALDSVLMQKANFNFEIIVGEDQSSDTTREIVTGYQHSHLNLKLFLNNHPAEYVRINGRKNFLNNLANAKGEYIALLDGDDFWTDPLKLQKQVDYLDKHPECSTVFHWADRLEDENLTPNGNGPPVVKDFYSVDDLLEHSSFIPTCSTLFRRAVIDVLPDWLSITPFGDLPLHVLNSLRGKIAFLNESMATRRIHMGGLYCGSSRVYRTLNYIICFEIMSFHLNFFDNPYYQKYMALVKKRLKNLILDRANLDEAIGLLEEHSDIYRNYPSIVTLLSQLITLRHNIEIMNSKTTNFQRHT